MKTFSASDAKRRFGDFIDRVQRGPVRVTRRGRVVGVMVSAEDCEAMRSFYRNRLQHTLTQTAALAASKGLTPQMRHTMWADES